MQSSLMLPNGLSVTCCPDNHDHCAQLRGEPHYKIETSEINTLHQAQPRAAVEKHWRPQSSHSGTSVIQVRQGPHLMISAHGVFTVTEEHEDKATQLTNLDFRQVHTSARFDTVCTFSSAKVSSAIASWNRNPLKPTCFDATLWPRRRE